MTAATGLPRGPDAASPASWGASSPPLPEQPDIARRGDPLGQSAMPVLRHGVPRARSASRTARSSPSPVIEKAEVNKGLLCVKGYHVGDASFMAKDRLTKPMIRKDATGRWSRSSGTKRSRPSPNATHHGARKDIRVLHLRAVDHPRGLRRPEIYQGRPIQQPHRPQRPALHGLGSHRDSSPPTASTSPPAATTTSITPTCVILWGNNPAEMHPSSSPASLTAAPVGEKVAIIDIGTRRTRTTEFAVRSLPEDARPQGDLAIANCIANQLFKTGSLRQGLCLEALQLPPRCSTI